MSERCLTVATLALVTRGTCPAGHSGWWVMTILVMLNSWHLHPCKNLESVMKEIANITKVSLRSERL